MEIDLEESLFYSKLILKNGDSYSGKKFRAYSQGYFMANENIKGYLEQEEFKKDRALTVLASGDHVFNLLANGVRTIDAFDVNKVQYYVYHLKKAAIQTFSFHSYLDFIQAFSCSYLLFLEEALVLLKKNLPEDVYEYFSAVFEYCKKKGRLGNLFYYTYRALWKQCNFYLTSEEAYRDLRGKLNDSDVHLFFLDARNLPRQLTNTYDIVLLSNIADYFGKLGKNLTVESYQEFIKKYYDLLNNGGVMINYLFGAFDNSHLTCGAVIDQSSICVRDLGEDNIFPLPYPQDHGYYRVRK